MVPGETTGFSAISWKDNEIPLRLFSETTFKRKASNLGAKMGEGGALVGPRNIIDKAAIVVYAFSFTFFNVIYWFVYLS